MGDILLEFKRLKLYSTELADENIYKICIDLQIHFTITILSSCWTEFQQGTTTKKWSKATDESRQYRQVFSQILCSLLMFTRNCVLRICHSVVMCVYVYDLHGFGSKQTILFFTLLIRDFLLLMLMLLLLLFFLFFRSLCSVKPEIYFTSRANHKNMVVLKAQQNRE